MVFDLKEVMVLYRREIGMKTNNSNTVQALYFCFVQETRLLQNEKLLSSAQEEKRSEKVCFKENIMLGLHLEK